jgi:hypothetical protein
MDVIPTEVDLRLDAIREWARHAIEGDCPHLLALDAIDLLSLNARLMLVEGEAA